MASMAELKIFLTGGAANADVTQSTGGMVSSTEVLSQSATGLTTLTGIVIGNAAGNNEGTGTLAYNSINQTLTWTPPGGTTGKPVSIDGDGVYFVQGGSNGGALILTVTAANLPNNSVSNQLTVAHLNNKLFADVSKDQSYAGTIIYHCFAIKNTGTDTKKNVKLWVASNTPGQDAMAIGLANAAAGDGATTGIDADTTSEIIAPADVTFSAPTSEAAALDLGDLSPASGAAHTRCFWIRQTVPELVETPTPNNTFQIGIAARV
ncbi:MAG: hypothetical protein IBX56_00115 [Methylomicrobium sp.]|nr:hypothetical protein [Methylomicrobium sp.]